jgi:LPS-assembly lipoprotein
LSSSRLPLAALFALAGCGLAGCGFSPLYGAGPDSTAVAQQLDQVEVANIPERTGQLLRQSLQDQLQAAGAPAVQQYSLNVSYSIAGESVGIQPDTSASRVRLIATATWSLTPIGQPGTKLTFGQATTEDALNVIDEQYFAQDLENNTVDQQLADEIAAQITSQVAVYFKTHPGAGSG